MGVPSEDTQPSDPAMSAGLSSAKAASGRAKCGPNAVVDEHVHPVRRMLRHFWAPVPWMLEATIILQIAIGQRLTALMIAGLLLFNVLLGTFQESRANAALDLLKQRLILRSGFIQPRSGPARLQFVGRPAANRPAGTQSMLVRYMGTTVSRSMCCSRMPACRIGSSNDIEQPSTKETRSSDQYSRMSVGSSTSLPSLNTE
jgi:hypothetical protein